MGDNFWKKTKKPILVLAPLAGITDAPMRKLCRDFGADVVYTEMTSIDGLFYDSRNTLHYLKKMRGEKPTVLQLFGKRPELVKKAVEMVEEAGFSGIDLNFGCPAKKVVNHEGGVTLLRNLNLCHELVQAVCEATKLPVSVKTRISINKSCHSTGLVNGTGKITVFDFIEKIKDLPVSTLILHGRSYEQGFVGPVDFEIMAEAKKQFKGIFIGNGNLNTPEDVAEMLEKTKADGVALARGIYGKPWLFSQIKNYLEKGKYYFPDLKEIKKTALLHAKYNFKMKGDHGIIEMRKYLCWYFRGFADASLWRQKLVSVTTFDEIKKILKEIK
ncbi:MAG: tRNA-dihydrouridine synthase [Patescibacteria group bacterium]